MLTEGSGGSSGGLAGEHQPDEPVRGGGSCVFRIYTPRLIDAQHEIAAANDS